MRDVETRWNLDAVHDVNGARRRQEIGIQNLTGPHPVSGNLQAGNIPCKTSDDIVCPVGVHIGMVLVQEDSVPGQGPEGRDPALHIRAIDELVESVIFQDLPQIILSLTSEKMTADEAQIFERLVGRSKVGHPALPANELV